MLEKFIACLTSLSSSSARCSFALQALQDGGKEINDSKVSGKTQKEQYVSCFHKHPDANLIYIATFTINSLISNLQSTQNNKKNDSSTSEHDAIEIASVLSSLCHLLSKSILSDRPRLERCSANGSMNTNSNSPLLCSRGTVARAIVSITLGSTLAMQVLTSEFSVKELGDLESSGTSSPESILRRDGLWNSILALEMMVYLSQKPNISSINFWGSSLRTTDNKFNQSKEFLEACEVVEKVINVRLKHFMEASLESNMTKKKVQHLSIDSEETSKSSVGSSSSKRARKQKVSKTSTQMSKETLPEAFPESLITFDGRISVRRWGSTSFTWLCKGQYTALEVANKILSDYRWTQILQSPSSSIPTRINNTPKRLISQRRTRQGTKNKNKADATQIHNMNTSKTGPSIPGNVACIALACRLIDLVDETGTSCGVRAPTGGIDIYAGIIFGIISPEHITTWMTSSASKSQASSKSGKGSSRVGRTRRSMSVTNDESFAVSFSSSISANKFVWMRPDIRTIAAVVINQLITAHTKCLEENYSERNLLLNLEGNSGKDTSVKTKVNFYPDLLRILDSLARSAASSIINSAYVDSSDGISRLSYISYATILSQIQEGKNLDAKLIGRVINKLEKTILDIFSATTGSEGGLKLTLTDKNNSGNDFCDFLDATRLAHMIRPDHKNDDEEKDKEDGSVKFCSYGGVFGHGQTQDKNESSARLKEEEMFIFFLRAMLTSNDVQGHDKKNLYELLQELSSSFLTKLFFILKLCYSSEEKSKMSRSMKIALATDVLNVIKTCLQSQSKNEVDSHILSVMEALRRSMNLNHVKDLIHLQPEFEKLIAQPHLADSPDNFFKIGDEGFTAFSSKNKEFTLPERQLW